MDPTSRMRRRLSARLALGCAIGTGTGVIVGAVVGIAISSGGWAVKSTMAFVACVIFGMAVGALVGGYSSLESPDPGDEPSDTQHPVTGRPELTRVEHDTTSRRDRS